MKATLKAHRDYTVGVTDPRLFGSFIEHFGRAVYGGIYEPGHPAADADGFREDVIKMINELNVSVVRYPGGNFLSGYNWEDGVGDRAKRPVRPSLAWFELETNQFGLGEFIKWCKKANVEPFMAVNLGTGGPTQAAQLLEYCNFPGGTKYSDMRREHGAEEPFGIKLWCLGNEMDGTWQIGAKTAEEYGRAACEAAKVMKWQDPSIELVACGSSGYGSHMFGEWERTVLTHTYDHVDYISLHTYYGKGPDDDTATYIARPVEMDKFIKGTAAVCDYVKAVKKTDKTVNLSFDEWNVWDMWKYSCPYPGMERWQTAPAVLEDIYSFEDVLVFGGMINALLNNAGRVKIACLAQLVNIIAPILTENNGPAWAQTIFYPFYYFANFGRGAVLDAKLDVAAYSTREISHVPYLDAAAVYNDERGELVIFAVNRSADEDVELDLNIDGFGKLELIEHVSMEGFPLGAVNTKDAQIVVPSVKETVLTEAGGVMVGKYSWNMLRFKR